MTATKCSRSWEIEAARDGRVDDEARALLAGHVARCSSCAREARVLDALGNGLGALPDPAADDVAVRRLKRRVLHSIDRDRTELSHPARRWGWLALGGAMGLGLVSIAVAIRSHRPHAPADPIVEVVPDPGARWATLTDHDVKRIDLESGTLHIRIDRHGGDRVVVIGLPDGQIDDIGTTFSVTVAFQRTRRVSVDQGSISLRLRGGIVAELAAGETWEPSAGEGAPNAASTSTPVTESPPRLQGSDGPPTPVPTLQAKPLPRPSAPPTKPHAPSSSETTDDEDQAYLEVLKRLRGGDVAHAHAAARVYVRTFPNGFRAPELRRLLGEPPARSPF